MRNSHVSINLWCTDVGAGVVGLQEVLSSQLHDIMHDCHVMYDCVGVGRTDGANEGEIG
jgi:hypothetical protein